MADESTNPISNEFNPEIDGDDSKTVQWINKRFKDDMTLKSRMSLIWEENIRFFAADQLLYYNQGTGSLDRIPLPVGVGPKAISNRYTPSIMNIIADLTRVKPTAVVVPESETPDAKLRAMLAEKLRYKMWSDLHEDLQYIRIALFLATTGVCLKKDAWDVNSKDAFSDVIPPWSFAFPNYATDAYDAENTPWIATWTVQDVNWVKNAYNGDPSGGFTGEAQNIQPEQIDNVIMRFIKLQTAVPRLGTMFSSTPIKGEFVVLKEVTIRPNANFPQGRYYVSVGDKLLYKNDSPYFIQAGYKTIWNPYTLFRYMYIPWKFFGMCPADDMVPLQRRINAIDTTVGIIRRKMSAPQWLIPKECKVPSGIISGDPGLRIEYTGAAGFKPEKIEPSNIPQHFWVERDKAEADMALISGDVDILRQHQPRGSRGVQSLQLMTEIVASRRAPVITLWETSIAASEEKKLMVYRRYAGEENTARLYPYIPEFGEDFVSTFFGDVVPITLKIEAGSNIPKLPSAQQQQFLAAMKLGVLGDPMDPLVRKEAASRLGLIGVETMWHADVRKAELENSAIFRGEFDQIMLWPFDNHQTELQVHTRAVKQPGFRSLPPESQNFLLSHIQQHLIQMQIQQGMMAQNNQNDQNNSNNSNNIENNNGPDNN